MENFLEEYKRLEKNLKKIVRKNVVDYENSCETEEREKLKICRLCRNYIQHQLDGKDFIQISPMMTEFIHELNISFEKQYEHASDRLNVVKPITMDMTLQKMANIIKNNDFVPLVDAKGNILAVLDNQALVELVDLGITKTIKVKEMYKRHKSLFTKTLSKYYFTKPDERLNLYHRKNKIVVIDDKDHYEGVVVW